MPARTYLRRRRVAALVAALLGLAGLLLGGRVLVYDAGLADVEGVEVRGAVTVPPGEVVAAAAVEPGTPLAGVDTAAVADRVAALPAVATVEVGRDWPNTVVVTVTERVPVAVARVSGRDLLVDATGLGYRPAPPDTTLPRLRVPDPGPGESRTVAALTVLAALPSVVREQVRAVDVDVTGGTVRVVLKLTDDREVRFGSPDRAEEKAAVLVPLLSRPGRLYDVASPELPTVGR